MIIKNAKTILFASLIAVMILPFAMTDTAFAEYRDVKIDRLGNMGVDLKTQIDNSKDQTVKEELIEQFDELKIQMVAIGIPTVEQYESDKEYWRSVAVQHHLDEEAESNSNDLKNIDYIEVACSSCDTPKIAKFQAGYGYSCYAGIWTCHAYASQWKSLMDGSNGEQRLTIGNTHDWIDPFWLVGGNQRMNITYTDSSFIEKTGPNHYYTPSGHVNLISSSSDVDTESLSRNSNIRANEVLDISWTVNNIR